MKRKMLFLVLILFTIQGAAWANPYVVIDEPELENSVVLLGDLYGQDELNYIIAQGKEVFLFRNGEKQNLISDIPGQVSALALGDMTGDFRNNLIVGTVNVGALYCYGQINGRWMRQEEPYYFWQTIRKLEVGDFDGDGWGDLVVLTEDGVAQILLSKEGKLFPAWRSPAGEYVSDWAVVDINQDGIADFVYTLQSGYIAVLSWQEEEFVTLWENFPWGQIESLAVYPNGNSLELIVATSQNMLYGWRWSSGEMVTSRHFYTADLGEIIRYIPNQGLLSLSKKRGVALFALKSSSVEERWRIPGISVIEAFCLGDSYLLRDSAGKYYSLRPSTGWWQIFVGERDVTESVQMFEKEGQFYFSLRDLANQIGFNVTLLEGWIFSKGDFKLKINLATNSVEYGDLHLPLAGSIVEKDDLLFGTAEICSLFGLTLEIDAARQRIICRNSWGWWL